MQLTCHKGRPSRCVHHCHAFRTRTCFHRLSAAGSPGPTNSTDGTSSWLLELATGRLWDKAQGDLPAVPWQPSDLLRVMGTTTAAGALFAAANMALRAQLDTQLPSAAATLDSSAALFDSTQLTASAVQHASQEALLALLFPAALWAALDAGKQQQQPLVPSKNATHPQPQQSGPSIDPSTSISPPQHGEDKSAKPAAAVCEANDPQAAAAAAAASTIGSISSNKAVGASPGRLLWCHMQWQGGAWLPQTLLVCAVVFPLADPLLSHAWRPVAEVAFGPQQPSPLVAQLHAATAQGQGGVVALHLLASGLLGPAWEEMFWRGFFLTALTKVLPLPLCVAASAFNFATLHLSPYNWLPLLLLGGSADVVYLRSGGNLAAPLLLHALWNSSQVLAIALAGKDSFV